MKSSKTLDHEDTKVTKINPSNEEKLRRLFVVFAPSWLKGSRNYRAPTPSALALAAIISTTCSFGSGSSSRVVGSGPLTVT
jgi:hypothetical protein